MSQMFPANQVPVDLTRRRSLAAVAAGTALAIAGTGRNAVAAIATELHNRVIPSSGELLPLVGLGSWISFNVGTDRQALAGCIDVVRGFFEAGGRVIDSSPMYGSSQPTIGAALARLGMPVTLFSAEKVWTRGGEGGAAQIEASRAFWGVKGFDLMQVHNLLAWREHLPRLFAMKAAGQLRYVGITTSHGRRHDELEQLMRTQPIDFVQLTYNVIDRDVEKRILPLAQQRGIAVIVNRPFQGGALTERLARHPVPAWASQIDCEHWAQIALKFVVSHPAVTCAIPATHQLAHLRQNMAAARGRLPDAAMRARIASTMASL